MKFTAVSSLQRLPIVGVEAMHSSSDKADLTRSLSSHGPCLQNREMLKSHDDLEGLCAALE